MEFGEGRGRGWYSRQTLNNARKRKERKKEQRILNMLRTFHRNKLFVVIYEVPFAGVAAKIHDQGTWFTSTFIFFNRVSVSRLLKQVAECTQFHGTVVSFQGYRLTDDSTDFFLHTGDSFRKNTNWNRDSGFIVVRPTSMSGLSAWPNRSEGVIQLCAFFIRTE